jgi:hypothetical protein
LYHETSKIQIKISDTHKAVSKRNKTGIRISGLHNIDKIVPVSGARTTQQGNAKLDCTGKVWH